MIKGLDVRGDGSRPVKKCHSERSEESYPRKRLQLHAFKILLTLKGLNIPSLRSG